MNTLIAIRNRRLARVLIASTLVGSVLAGGSSAAAASGPNIVAQWNKVAEDVVVASGAFQIEGLVYMSYTQLAVFDALVAIDGGYAPYGHAPRRAGRRVARCGRRGSRVHGPRASLSGQRRCAGGRPRRLARCHRRRPGEGRRDRPRPCVRAGHHRAPNR